MSTIMIALGNGGGNVIDDFRKLRPNITDIEYLYLDEDAKQLECHGKGNERKLILERSCKTLRDILAGRYDVAILVVCLGGFTGNYYGDAVAEELRKSCNKLLCIASLPFKFEGCKRRVNAIATLGNIKRWCDLTATQDNGCLTGDIDLSDINSPMVASLGVIFFSQNGIITFYQNGHNKIEEDEKTYR